MNIAIAVLGAIGFLVLMLIVFVAWHNNRDWRDVFQHLQRHREAKRKLDVQRLGREMAALRDMEYEQSTVTPKRQ